LVGKATTDTLTNKTLTGAVMNGTLGATTPSTGAFTTLTSTGASSFATSSGSVGIGTSSPTNPLHIVSNTVSQLNVAASSGNTNAQINLEPTGTGIALIGPANSVAFAFRTNATERARFNSTGALVFNGGTTTADGIGITFPAAQSASSDANTLDDYEEGNWTPSVGGTATYGAQTGYYVKVGKIVYVKGTIITTLIGTGSTNTISGLPFTCRVTTPLSVAYFDTINTAATFLGIRISQANTTMLLVGTTAAQATITDSFSTFKNGTYLEFAGVYEVA
tara:strand:+ start:120 stop:953 length:834 start_codon:yes stop_codon:yes gene_type:complete